jgi:hypothetical protein
MLNLYYISLDSIIITELLRVSTRILDNLVFYFLFSAIIFSTFEIIESSRVVILYTRVSIYERS